MKGLLVVAHGSRRPESNDEVRQLTQRLREKAGNEFSFVACAFLELAEPSIAQGIDSCIRHGAKEIDVLPYFLSAGTHVSLDIPEIIAPKQRQYPHIPIKICGHMGAADGVVELLLSLLE